MDSFKIIPSSQQIQNNLGDGYLEFWLNKRTAAVLSIKYTQEVIIIPFQSVTSMPNMHPCVLGLINWQNHILWLIDLPKMLNLEDSWEHRQHSTIIIRGESSFLGLAVPKIKGTTRFLSNKIQFPDSQFCDSLLPYLCGYIMRHNEMVIVLDAPAIFSSAIFQRNQ
jgi:twitching motility protein PilI